MRADQDATGEVSRDEFNAAMRALDTYYYWAEYIALPGYLKRLQAPALVVDDRINSMREAFISNLRAIVTTAAIPRHLMSSAMAAIHARDQHRLHSLLGMLASKGVLRETPQERAKREQALVTRPSDEEGDRIALFIARLLIDFAESDSIGRAYELLRQSTVLLWGAFEVCCKDVIAALLNARPELLLAVQADPRTRKQADPKSIDIDMLSAHGFNLSQCMGDWYTENSGTWSLQLVRDTLSVVCPHDAALHEALAHPALWQLSNDRHLIVHRSGVVDEKYRRQTGSQVPIGERIIVLPADLRAAAERVSSSGAIVLGAVSSCFAQ